MHSFLLVGTDEKKLDAKITGLIAELKTQPYEFKLEKITDARGLISFTRLSVSKPTTIIIKNIDRATHEALNAFLKNLEEPQKNLSYIITSSSIYNLLPTIVSRCQVIHVSGQKKVEKSVIRETKQFLRRSEDDKLGYIYSIREREMALEFIERLVLGAHDMLLNSKNSYATILPFIKSAEKTHQYLGANGNVGLQMANFVLSLA